MISFIPAELTARMAAEFPTSFPDLAAAANPPPAADQRGGGEGADGQPGRTGRDTPDPDPGTPIGGPAAASPDLNYGPTNSLPEADPNTSSPAPGEHPSTDAAV